MNKYESTQITLRNQSTVSRGDCGRTGGEATEKPFMLTMSQAIHLIEDIHATGLLKGSRERIVDGLQKLQTDTLSAAQFSGFVDSELGARMAQEELEALFEPDDLVELRSVPVGTALEGNERQVWNDWVKPETAAATVQKNSYIRDDQRAAYYGVNPRRKAGGSKDKDVAARSCLFVDLDRKDAPENDSDWSKTLAALIKLEPVIAKNSGNGFHVQFRLERGVETKETQTLIKSALLRLGADDMSPPAALSRLSGTLNFPSKGKQKRGYTVTLCRPVHGPIKDARIWHPHELGIALEVVADRLQLPGKPRKETSATQKTPCASGALSNVVSGAFGLPSRHDPKATTGMAGKVNTGTYRFPAPSLEYVREALALIKNDAGVDYNAWRDVGYAVYGASQGTDFQDDALQAFISWSATNPLHDDAETSKLLSAIAKTDQVHSTMLELKKLAERFGGDQAEQHLRSVEAQAQQELHEKPPAEHVEFLARFQYVETENVVFDVKRRKALKQPQFSANHEARMAIGATALTGQNSAWSKLMMHPGKQSVDSLGYAPGEPEIFENRYGDRRANKWRPNPLEPLAEEPTAYLELCAQVFPNVQDRVYWHDLLATKFQNIGISVPVFVVLVSAGGLGKDTMLNAIQWAFGEENCANVNNKQMESNFDEYLVKPLICLKELNARGNMDFYGKMKSIVGNNHEVRINPKCEPTYLARPCALLIADTNDLDCIKTMQSTDRRTWVYHNPVDTAKLHSLGADVPLSHAWFKHLRPRIETEEEARRIRWFYENRDVSAFQMLPVPKTAAKKHMAREGLSAGAKEVLEVLEENAPGYLRATITEDLITHLEDRRGTAKHAKHTIRDSNVAEALIEAGWKKFTAQERLSVKIGGRAKRKFVWYFPPAFQDIEPDAATLREAYEKDRSKLVIPFIP